MLYKERVLVTRVYLGLPLDKTCIDYSSNGSTVSLIEFHGINLTKVLPTNQDLNKSSNKIYRSVHTKYIRHLAGA